MKRLMENTVVSGFVTACRFATCPTSRSPDLVKPTTEGVSRPPSELVMTTGSPPSITATTELVVPRSIPMILLMRLLLFVPCRAQRANLSLSEYSDLSVYMSSVLSLQTKDGPAPVRGACVSSRRTAWAVGPGPSACYIRYCRLPDSRRGPMSTHGVRRVLLTGGAVASLALLPAVHAQSISPPDQTL